MVMLFVMIIVKNGSDGRVFSLCSYDGFENYLKE